MKEAYSKLIEKGMLYSIETDLESLFKNIFENFYIDCPYEDYEHLAIPEDYAQFIEMTKNEGVAFYKTDQYIYGLYQMIYYTIYDMNCVGDKEEKPSFWLYIGHRNDRGYFFICCDKRLKSFGQVCEFYDGSPFMNKKDGIELGDFKTFCNAILNGGA